MEIVKKFKNKNFKYSEISNVFKFIFEEYHLEIENQKIKISSNIDNIQNWKIISLTDLKEIIDFDNRCNSISMYFNDEFMATQIHLFKTYDILTLRIESKIYDDLINIINIFQKNLNLEDYIFDETQTIEYRLDKIEEKLKYYDEIITEKENKVKMFYFYEVQ